MTLDDARLTELLTRAIALDRATKGNVQAFDPETKSLKIVCQHGFGPEFLEHFKTVLPFDPSACGRAFGGGDIIMIPDVLRDEAFEPHRAVALASGFRSVKSIPVMNGAGLIFGVLSTHSPDIRWDWERDNTRRIAAEIADVLAAALTQLSR